MNNPFDIWRRDAEAVLVAAGLPVAPWVEHETEDRVYITALDCYVEEWRGFPFGSVENLAARVINRIGQYEDAPEDGRELWAREVQYAQTRLVVAWRNRKAGAKGGQRRKKSAWAERAAERVTAWNELPTTTPWEFEDLLVRVYRDGDQLCAADIDDLNVEPKTLARSTFEKRYLRK